MTEIDYAFAPGQVEAVVGEVSFDDLMRELVSLRRPHGALKPTTILVATSGTLQNFLIELQQSPRISRPVGDLVLVSHASETGWLDMTLADETRGKIGYEALLEVGEKIRIPSEILKMADGKFRAIDVIIKGCRIGIARPFLLRLKQALQPSDVNVAVLAPKHYQAAYRWTRKDGKIISTIASIEFLQYCFESYSLIELKNRQQVIDLFKSDKHKFFDNSDVPDAAWKKWVPKGTPRLAVPIDLKLGLQVPATWDIPDDILPDLATDKLFLFKYEIDTMAGQWPLSPAPPGANKQVEREHICAELVLRQDNCKSTHPWPLWKRFLKKRYESFTSLEELVDGYNWEYHELENKGWWTSMRHLYRCVIPITNPVGSNILLGNYYPVSHEKAAHVDLDITNPQLFEWVNE